jgi:hypothetical protein
MAFYTQKRMRQNTIQSWHSIRDMI